MHYSTFNRLHIETGRMPLPHNPLFFVIRESRYETAKFDGGRWYPLDLGKSLTGEAGPMVYANLNKDHIRKR